MEDFGYQRDNIQNRFSDLTKKVFLIAATLFSISCFIYVTISAYYFIYQDEDSNIEVIHAKKGKIKIIAENKGKDKPMRISNSIYEDIFGSNNSKKEATKTKIRKTPKPAIPPKSANLDRRLIKKSASANTKPKKASKQKIIVYSDSNKNRKSAKDLLTKIDGKKRTTTTKRKSRKRAVRVQIAAMTSRASAQKNWNTHNRRYPKLFANLKPFIQEVNLGKRGIFFRLQIGNFYNQVEAEQFCNRYIVKSQKSRADCIVVE